MRPVVALVGRPNVGKSTLFNRLTRSRAALVADQPGLTRDRNYGVGRIGDRPYIVVDTGGLSGEKEGIDARMAEQVFRAIGEADTVLFIVDGRAGLTGGDQSIAEQLRRFNKPVHLLVNKAEGMDETLVGAEFQALGLGEPHAISAAHGRGVAQVMEGVLAEFPIETEAALDAADTSVKIAIIGRPNVGKSTLVNRLLGEERVLAFDAPGTTRDSIFIPFKHEGRHYTLIDTAGVRRRGRVTDAIEKFSVIKTLQAIEVANVVIMVIDAREGLSDQDASLAGFAIESGRAMVIAVNKWDGLAADARERVKSELDRRLPFLDFAEMHFISALHGSGVGHLMAAAQRAYDASVCDLPTPQLTRVLEDAVAQHQPPIVHGRRIKLRYAHQGGRNPPVIVIHGNQTDAVPESYTRYLMNTFRRVFSLAGTPMRIEYRSGANPYEGKKNPLTPRQVKKRRRLMAHAKKGK